MPVSNHNNLQGLNIVHPAQDSGDSHDLLLGQVYPDLTAQLDLWTNLAFDSEDPLTPRHEDKNAADSVVEEEEEEARSPVSREKAVHDGHVNVVTPTNVPVNQNPKNSAAAQSASLFDINSFLSSFGIDAFTAHPSQLQQQPTTITPSLAQLLALHSAHNPTFSAGLPQYVHNATATPFVSPTVAQSEESYVPTAKRARTRRVSVASTDSPDFREESLPPNPHLSPAEDKRRRNTAASARFRLKKKEREAALEGKAKELETKVNELERECEGLRRENGWLKGLVVGVTGAAQGPTGTGLTVASSPVTTTTVGSKRRRDESTT